jgi:glutathione S-transferase
MTQNPVEPITITSHPLCPFMHAWRMVLAATGRVAGRDFEVRRLEYKDVATWGPLIPTGADIPWMTTKDKEVLSGTLPVLQFIEETIPGAELLADDATERVRSRNRALLAVEVLTAMRLVFVSKTHEEERATTEALFGILGRCEAQPWSSHGRIDWVLLAAASTILASRAKIMIDARWSAAPKTKALVLALSKEDVVVSTRIGAYDDEFREFYKAFGGTFEASAAQGG